MASEPTELFDPRAYSRQDYTNAVAQALRAKDVKGAVHLVEIMARVYPQEAQDVYDTLVLGVEIARAGDG